MAECSGVALPTLRKFEQKDLISLESFLKLQMVFGGLDKKNETILANTNQVAELFGVQKAAISKAFE